MRTKKTLLAVFGHYDSRGGTAAIPITANSPGDIQAAKDRYNRDFFGYDPKTDRAERAGVGRQCDILVDQLVRDGETPADADFMYVAELYHRGEIPKVDLADGMNNGGYDVLIELEDDYRGGNAEFDTLKDRVVRLELVQIPEGFFKDIFELEDLDAKTTEGDMNLRYPPEPNGWKHSVNGMSSSEPEQIGWMRRAFKERSDRREGMKIERLKKLAKKLKHPTQTRWDDDAYGFIVMGGGE